MANKAVNLQALKADAVKAQSSFGENLLTILLPSIEVIFISKFVEFLETVHTKNPTGYKTTLTSVYPPVDVHLESLVAKTKTKFDDSFIKILKTSLEESAKLNDITLPNLDSD